MAKDKNEDVLMQSLGEELDRELESKWNKMFEEASRQKEELLGSENGEKPVAEEAKADSDADTDDEAGLEPEAESGDENGDTGDNQLLPDLVIDDKVVDSEEKAADSEENKETEQEEEGKSPEPESSEKEEAEEHDPFESPKIKKRLDRQKQRLEREAREREDKLRAEYEAKIAELSKKVESVEQSANNGLSDAEREELIMLRRRIDVESDPEIRKQFDDKIQDNRDAITEILLDKFRLPENQERIKEIGDFAEFSRREPKAASDILDALAEHDPISAEIIKAKIAENVSLQRAKKRAIEEASKKAKEYFEERNKKLSEVQNAEKQRLDEMGKLFAEGVKRIYASEGFRDIDTTGLDGDKKKEVEATNALRAKMRNAIEWGTQALANNDMKGVLQMIAAAAKTWELQDTINKLKAQNEELNGRIEARKKASSVAKEGRVSSASAPKPSPKKPNTPQNIDEWEAQLDEQARKIGWL